MKKLLILSLIFLLPFGTSQSQPFRKIRNDAFQRGEKLKFRVYYDALLTGKVTAGIATIEVRKDVKKYANRNTYHIEGQGESKGTFNWFFKVRDKFESYIDEEALVPWFFVRRTQEGGYVRDDDVLFNHYDKYAVSRTAKKMVPDNVQDILSALYYARNIDFSGALPGDEYSIPFFLDDSVYVSKIVYLGKEVVKTDAGKFSCMKFKPMVATGSVFKDQYPMTLWVTDDKNHLPILAVSAVIVGSVKMELIDYAGLANPMTSRIR